MNEYKPKENKLKNQVTKAKSMLEDALGTTKTKITQTKKIKALIEQADLSNLKRSFWIGVLLGKHGVDYFEESTE